MVWRDLYSLVFESRMICLSLKFLSSLNGEEEEKGDEDEEYIDIPSLTPLRPSYFCLQK